MVKCLLSQKYGSWKGSASHGLWGVSGDTLRERNLLEAIKMGFLSSSLSARPC